ncbi:uncharacterized protein MELLADRAFT_60680 [Melampsora larici-populina 98AG31]|uniref:SWIM-type domain-containing protein n=1 Tax=Melampsora larici-populina (strain 98AG31 / pathotype 3-4-7) TaxID=747676 RepID=F4RBY0_MELLP|nr:uncharacterized protein MELLADRAFT_60680 [Melampsora larici-populina 98AG31]EGG10261.1 hypothetical protein MELLADRAFT_60680 [Melampsora larici-populina 98AG31]
MYSNAMAVIYARQWQDTIIKFRQDYPERDVPMQGIHTNNFTESYHRVLKYNFLSRHTLRRPDDLFQTLADNAEPDFRQSVLTTTLGFRPQRATKYQNVAEGLPETYSNSDLVDLGVEINSPQANKWTISSFTRPKMATYTVNTTPPKDGTVGYVNNCNCTHFLSNKLACKHMYVIARQNTFNILETNPEVDDGTSPFEFRRIVEPFNIVVRTLTNVHIDSPPPSPVLNPYRSSAALGRTPSTSGLANGNYRYAPMVPAPLPYQSNIANLQQPQEHTLHHTTPPGAAQPSMANPVLHCNPMLLPYTGRTDPSSDLYIEHLFYNPHHLQSTPPPHCVGPYAGIVPPQNAMLYPNSPFSRDAARNHQHTQQLQATSLVNLTNNSAMFCTRNPQHTTSSSPHAMPRQYYTLTKSDAADHAPPPPPRTRTAYQLDPQSLFQALNQYSAPHAPQPSTSGQHIELTPERTPAPVTTSQLDGLFDEMDRARQPPAPPNRSYRKPLSTGNSATVHRPLVPVPGATRPGALANETTYNGLPFSQNMYVLIQCLRLLTLTPTALRFTGNLLRPNQATHTMLRIVPTVPRATSVVWRTQPLTPLYRTQPTRTMQPPVPIKWKAPGPITPLTLGPLS